MATMTYTTLQDLLTEASSGPFVSLYMPLEANQSADKSKLMMRHLLTHAKEVMASAWPDVDWAPFADLLQPLVDDPSQIASLSGQGIGVLANSDAIYIRDLEYPVSEMAMVTAMPQILPLLLDDQRHLDFDLLTLQGDQIGLYHNAGDVLTPVALGADAPLTLKGTLGTELRGGSLNSVRQGGPGATYHGHNAKSEEDEIDRRRYYQAVDSYVADHFSKPNARRLVVMGLPQNIAMFREVSRNTHLSGSMQVEASPANMTLLQLDEAVNPVRLEHVRQRQEAISAQLDGARSKGRYLEDVGGIIDALHHRAIAQLVIRQGARINGRLHGQKIDTESEMAKHNNLLNDLADLTIAQGGTVNVLPSDLMEPAAAAIRRYSEE
ncbi:baeRF6 domain-containing protein [Lacticaseibacillus yichunensis]|uniref:Bacterial archaeo-eukaryotic release factor family 6 domain-containing protein n=1 Tax=Lacticaseibacillus yichunensis TaxID=2486015 RepID=A0ABW4CU69_9LACO|nr:hypothetical protein [Lacticaseibacillus yichunensis]